MKFILFITLLMVIVAACKHDTVTEENTSTRTPITITSASNGPLNESIQLNATARFQLKTSVKASTNGYLQNVNASIGQYINQGASMFTIKTKEAQSLGNIMNKLDTSLQFQGVIKISSPGSGYVTQLNHQAGDYVQEGDALATIADKKSLVFMLQLPYELKSLIASNHQVILQLPDGTQLNGTLGNEMPNVDSLSQTLNVPIHIKDNVNVPENLMAKVQLFKQSKTSTTTLPKTAVLTDEAQSEWWIMKLINDSTAIKVTVKKGMETNDRVEILSPTLDSNDRVVITGNYGLTDTAGVIITKSQQ